MSLLSLKAPQEIIPLFVLFVAVSASYGFSSTRLRVANLNSLDR
jgi:hypothetical protein